MFFQRTPDKEYQMLKQAVNRNDKNIDKMVAKLFHKYQSDEFNLARICSFLYFKRVESGIPLIMSFCESFPHSEFPVKIYAADIMRMNGDAGIATEFARDYLRLAKDNGYIGSKILEDPNLRQAITIGFRVLPIAYIRANSFSDCIRIMDFALSLPLDAEFVDLMNRLKIQMEIDQKKADVKQVDEMFLLPFETEQQDGTPIRVLK